MHPIRRGPSLWKTIWLQPRAKELKSPPTSRQNRLIPFMSNMVQKASVAAASQTTSLPAPLFFVAKSPDRIVDHLDLWNYEKFRPDYACPTEYQLYLALSGFVNIYRELGKTFTPYRKRRQVIFDIVLPLSGVGNILFAVIEAFAVIPYFLLIISGLDLLWRQIKLQRGGYKNSEEMSKAAREHLLLCVVAPIIDVMGSALHGLFQIAFSPINYCLRMPLRGILYLYNRKAIQNAKVEEGKSYRELVARGNTLIRELNTDGKSEQERSHLAIHLLWVCYRLRTKFYSGRHTHKFGTDMPQESSDKLKTLWDQSESKDAAWINDTSICEPNLCALATQSETDILHHSELLKNYFSLFKFNPKKEEPVTAPNSDKRRVRIVVDDTAASLSALSAAAKAGV